jgi:hypothetical protein
MYHLLVYFPGETVAVATIHTPRGSEILRLIPKLLAEHDGCEHIVVMGGDDPAVLRGLSRKPDALGGPVLTRGRQVAEWGWVSFELALASAPPGGAMATASTGASCAVRRKPTLVTVSISNADSRALSPSRRRRPMTRLMASSPTIRPRQQVSIKRFRLTAPSA